MQYLSVNDINIAVLDCLFYESADKNFCVQIELVDKKDIEIIAQQTNIVLLLNNFKITGLLQQIIHSKDNIYIIVLQGGTYSYDK